MKNLKILIHLFLNKIYLQFHKTFCNPYTFYRGLYDFYLLYIFYTLILKRQFSGDLYDFKL